MKRIVLAVAVLLGGASAAYAEPPGLTPPAGEAPQQAAGPTAVDPDPGYGAGYGAGYGGGYGAPGPQAPGDDQAYDGQGYGGPGYGAPGHGRMMRGGRGMRDGQPGERGPRGRHRRLPPQLRARLMARFDRNGDGRLEGPERRAARQFVRTVIVRRHLARQGFGPRRGQGR
ncbi:MAG TPA: hypothetical protein VHE35_23330 [Kofleriaceae bacterium]|nr:hypothetical protein [Kofleriaceae bacterium]